MKNLKKLVSVMVTVAMLISSLAAVSVSADYDDVDATNSYYKAIKVLSGLDIVKGDDQGNFNPTNNIKRSEAVALVCRMVGEDAFASTTADAGFDDVPADHWAAGYIAWGVASEVVKGVGDNKFDPDAPVKFQDIIVMITRVTGYERIANRASYGGYPTGYLKVASQYGLLNNGIANYAGAKAATREVVAQALYNGLTMPLVHYTSYGENPEDDRYVIYDGRNNNTLRTTLTYTGKVYKVKAEVRATAISDADLRKDADNHKVRLYLDSAYDYTFEKEYDANGTVSNTVWRDLFDATYGPGDTIEPFVGETDIAEYPGCTVEAYIAWDKDLSDWKLLAAVVDANAVATETVSDNIVGYNATTGVFEYKANIDDEKILEIKTKTGNDLSVYYNGKELATDAEKAAVGGIQNVVENADVITFMGDRNEKYDKIYVTNYLYRQVEKVRPSDLFIDFTVGTLKLDKETRGDDFLYNIYDVDGNAITIDEIEEDDICNIVIPLNGTVRNDLANVNYVEIYVTDTKVEGVINGRDDTVGAWAIDGEYYELYSGSNYAPTMGDEGTFFLTIDGKIYDSEAVSSINRNYAMILAKDSEDYMGKTRYDISLFTVDGEVVVYPLASSVKVVDAEGNSAKAKDSDGTLAALYGRLPSATGLATEAAVRATYPARFTTYKVNANGEISELRFTNSQNPADEFFYASFTNARYSEDNETFNNVDMAPESVLFVVPTKAKDLVNASGETPVAGQDGVDEWYIDTDKLAIVSYADLDEDNDQDYDGYMFNYEKDNGYIGASVLFNPVTDNIEKTHLAVLKSSSVGLNAAGDEITNLTFVEGGEVKTVAVDLEADIDVIVAGTAMTTGDIFRYTVDKDGEIDETQLIYDISADLFDDQGLTYAALDTNDIAIVAGKVTEIKNGRMLVDTMSTKLRFNDTEGNTYAYVNLENIAYASAVKVMDSYDSLIESYDNINYYVVAIVGESGKYEDCVQIYAKTATLDFN